MKAADRDPVLASLEQVLLEYRDEAEQDMEKYPGSRAYHHGSHNAFRVALHALHTRTDGAYGQPFKGPA